MKVTPNFHFRGNCMEAIDLYKEVFDISILCLYKNKDADPNDYISNEQLTEQVYHAEVMLGNTRLMMSDVAESNPNNSGNPLSLVITYDSAEEVKRVYDLLKVDATIISPMQRTTYSSCFVSLIDRFGMRWELMTEQTEK